MGASAKTVDMTQVKDRKFNVRHLPEGDYRAKVVKVEDHKSKQNNFQWLYTIVIVEGKGKGCSYPYYCGVSPQELWKVRNLFVAAGINVPKKKMKLDPNKVVGREVGIQLEDDEYEGKPKSIISGVIPVSEIGDATEDAGEDDEEIQTSSKKSKGSSSDKSSKKKGKKGKGGISDKELEEIEV